VTLLLPLRFAVLIGIGASIVYYLLETSRPRVRAVKMSDDFRYFAPRPEQPSCPQLAVIEILGDLYFGAVNHVETTIDEHAARHPRQRFLLLRMYAVENCDISGIRALEAITQTYRDRGGDVYFVHVQEPVLKIMKSSGFYDYVGEGHFLDPDRDVSYLFYGVIDPAICIYECAVRAFEPCQNLPKQLYEGDVGWADQASMEEVPIVSTHDLWRALDADDPPLVVDVREPREFQKAHIPQASLTPLPKLMEDSNLPQRRPVVLVCHGGRRSTRAAAMLRRRGHDKVMALEGGMQAWERDNLLEAVRYDEEDP
jgi:SulP family sulfate permease